jgi:uncharacterized protein YegL
MPLPNPSFPDRCGLNLALVIDESGSIDSAEYQLASQAMFQFVDALSGTPSSIGVVAFSSDAQVLLQLTRVTDPSMANAVKDVIANRFFISGGTNWFAALEAAETLGSDLIIFCTDGLPSDALDASIVVADRIKTAGTSIIAVGIGNDINEANLQLISGPTINQDYYLADFATLSRRLRDIALRLCGASVTVVKTVQMPDGRYAPAAGWQFVANMSNSVSPTIAPSVSGMTGDDGTVNFKLGVQEPASVTVMEIPREGFVSAGVISSKNGTQPLQPIEVANGISLTISSEDIVSCEFRSDRVFTFLPAVLPDGKVNEVYTVTVVLDKATPPVQFSVVSGSLPPGVSLSPDGLISGTPTADGQFAVTIAAVEADGFVATQTYSVAIAPAEIIGTPPKITLTPPPVALVGQPFSYTVVASGVPQPTLSLEPGAPNGLTLDASTGEISWVPPALGTYIFQVRAANGVSPDAIASLNIVVDYGLVFSKNVDRSAPVRPLAGATVDGSIYAFVVPDAGIDKARFGLNSPTGNPSNLERNPPFDFRGSKNSIPIPLDTLQIRNGNYVIFTELLLLNGTIRKLNTPFSIANSALPPSAYKLVFSKNSDRRPPLADLNGATVSGKIYGFVQPEVNINEVRFWIDNPDRRPLPRRAEQNPPYDIAGDDGSKANPLDTRRLTNGRHTITAEIVFLDNTKTIVQATITVQN